MISLTIKITPIKFDSEKFLKSTQKTIQNANKKGIKAFLLTVLKIIPIYTGMAQASLLRLGSLINMHWAISPSLRTRSKGWTTRLKSRVQEGENLGEAGFIKSGTKIGFYVRSRVKHLNINEQIDPRQFGIYLRSQAPWRSFEKGKKAAMTAIINHIKKARTTKISDYLIKGRIYHLRGSK